MRFVIMHKTTPHWEAGAKPGPGLLAKVERMIAGMADAGVLLGAEGLRESSLGVRLRFSGGRRTVVEGPFVGGNELPAGFALLRVESIDDAVAWATRFAGVMGDMEIDIRPLSEPWDLGIAPKPEGLTTTRFMAMHKADAASEAGARPSPAQLAAMGRLVEEMSRAGVLLATEAFQPSSKGARLRSAGGKHELVDGPFTESKELVGGYVIVRAESLDEAKVWALRYVDAVGCSELDVRPLAERA